MLKHSENNGMEEIGFVTPTPGHGIARECPTEATILRRDIFNSVC